METLNSWSVLLNAAGETLEDAGKLLKDGNTDLSTNDLINVRDGLLALANTLDRRITFLIDGN